MNQTVIIQWINSMIYVLIKLGTVIVQRPLSYTTHKHTLLLII